MPNSPPSDWSSKFPTYSRLLHWLFSWRTFGRALVGLGALVTVIALFYGEENWRGRRAWYQYRHAIEAGGVQLDFKGSWPKPVPDDQNFAATPFVKSWFELPYNSDKIWKDNFSLAGKALPHAWNRTFAARWPGKRQFVDLVAWQGAFSAIRTRGNNQELRSPKLDLDSRAQAAPAILEALKETQ